MSITLAQLTSGYNLAKINSNFTLLKDAHNNVAFWLSGGNNTMQQDIDVNSNNLLNVNSINTKTLMINGTAVVPGNLGSFAPGSVGTVQIVDGAVTDSKIVSVTGSKATFIQSGAGAVLYDLQTKGRESLSVQDFGAKLDGITDDSAAFQAAYDACPALGTILVPRGTCPPPTVTGTKWVRWDCIGQPTVGDLFNLPGLVESDIATRKVFSSKRTTGSDYAGVEFRRETNHTGGTPGNVNSAVVVYTSAAPGVTNFEWGFLSVLDNNTNVAGENVAVYGQANKKNGNAGQTFAGVFEARNNTNAGEIGGGLVGIEVDVFSNGTDTNSNRIGIDVSLGKGDPAGLACGVTAGIRVGPTNGDNTQASIGDGLRVNGVVTNGVNVSTAAANAAYRVGGVGVHGLDTSAATLSGVAVRTARGQAIAFEPTSTFQMRCDPSVAVIRIDNSGTEKVGFEIDSNPALRINSLQVVGQRSTGWGAMTGSANQATIYDTSTITLSQLAGRVMALQAALTTHGLIGT